MEYIACKTILQKNKTSDWFGNDYNMNLYRGCPHGCIYCDSRSDCYHLEQFDTVRAKENCIAILREELQRKMHTGVIGTGSMSDPYNPFEREACLTRQALGVIAKHHFGVTVITKSDLIVRDIDMYQQIAKNAPVLCKMTITTCDDRLCRKVEPHVTPSSRRFEALAKLSSAGLKTGITMMPILPFLEDSTENILGIVQMAHLCGVKYIYPAFGMTLRQNQRDYYFEKLDTLFPALSETYRNYYGNRYECVSPHASELWHVFSDACAKYGILYEMPDIIRDYQKDYTYQQLSLFD